MPPKKPSLTRPPPPSGSGGPVSRAGAHHMLFNSPSTSSNVNTTSGGLDFGIAGTAATMNTSSSLAQSGKSAALAKLPAAPVNTAASRVIKRESLNRKLNFTGAPHQATDSGGVLLTPSPPSRVLAPLPATSTAKAGDGAAAAPGVVTPSDPPTANRGSRVGSGSLNESSGSLVSGSPTANVAPPPGGSRQGSGGVRGGRAGRLLRDARAAVAAPFRPETPMDLQLLLAATSSANHGSANLNASTSMLLQGPSGAVAAAKKGRANRLAPLTPLASTVSSSSSFTPAGPQKSSSEYVSPRTTALGDAALDVDSYVAELARASEDNKAVGDADGVAKRGKKHNSGGGSSTRELELLSRLHAWLQRSSNALWEDVLCYFCQYIHETEREHYHYVSRSAKNDADRQQKRRFDIQATDVLTAIKMTSLTLHSSLLSYLTSSDEAGEGSDSDRDSNTLVSSYRACARSVIHFLKLVALHERSNGFAYIARENLVDPLLFVLQNININGGGGGSDNNNNNSSSNSNVGRSSTAMLYDILTLLEECTSSAYDAEPDDADGEDSVDGAVNSSSIRSDSDALDDEHHNHSHSKVVISQLIKLGLIPALNKTARRLMAFDTESAEGDITPSKYQQQRGSNSNGQGEGEGGHQPQQVTMQGTLLIPSICLILKNISVDYAQYLDTLGSLEVLTSVLLTYRNESIHSCAPGNTAKGGSVTVVEAAARALAKIVFEKQTAKSLQANSNFLRVIMNVLYCQLEVHRPLLVSSLEKGMALRQAGATSTNGGDGSGVDVELIRLHILVSRLCTVIAQVCEGQSALQDFLATQGEAALLPALVEYFILPDALATNNVNSANDSVGDGDGDAAAAGAVNDAVVAEEAELSLVQAIAWVIGCASRSPHCSPTLALRLLSPMTKMLRDSELTVENRSAILYTLMCISNLSFYFPQIEALEGPEGAEGKGSLRPLCEVLGVVLAGFLFDGEVEAAVEATRALGNLSFTNTGRDWMESERCDEVMLIFLGHEDLRVVYNCFGTILNLTAGTRCRLCEDGELLQLLLRQTQRFTTAACVEAAAREEHRVLLEQKEQEAQRTKEERERKRKKTKAITTAAAAKKRKSTNSNTTTTATAAAKKRKASEAGKKSKPSTATATATATTATTAVDASALWSSEIPASALHHHTDKKKTTKAKAAAAATPIVLERELAEQWAEVSARGYAQQVADLVEKVLINVKGLLDGLKKSAVEDEEQEGSGIAEEYSPGMGAAEDEGVE